MLEKLETISDESEIFMEVISGLSTREDFRSKVLWSELDWLTDRDAYQVVIDSKYADDRSFIRTDEIKMNQVKRLLPDLLKKGNLTENESKRDYQMRRTCGKHANV